ncbi:CRTAC1 family protein [Mucilaginibacter segetis]|uniref:VCBS repeat-containing protein n=1 Tax=Mucilaginibacter segetis TaxID=2793071 RepID=A0A934ULX8_9SPHI|nr:CRTAC1 family protein [Mucilaginibacter segetis]MBK0378430.1 VCBS repeat-containing protein [Mucilaginibacter segetis]
MQARALPSKTCLNLLLISLAVILLSVGGCKQKNNDDTDDNSKASPRELGLEYIGKNQLNEAEASFVKAIKIDPDNVSNYIILCRLHLLQKNYTAAQERAEAGLKISPGNTDLELILAEAYDRAGNIEKALAELKKIITADPKNIQAYYKLAAISGSNLQLKKQYLLKVTALAPANIVPQLELAEIYAANNKTDSARYFLESVKKIAPDFSAIAEVSYQKALSLLQAGKPAVAMTDLKRFHEIMKTTVAYSTGKDDISVTELMAGLSNFTTNVTATQGNGMSGDSLYKTIRFADASPVTGLALQKPVNAERSVLSVADYDAEGNFYVYTSFSSDGNSSSQRHLFITKSGTFTQSKDISTSDFDGQDLDAAFVDYDNDGYLDLFIATTKGIVIYKNQADGTLHKIDGNIGLSSTADTRKMLFADLDQDGDLDLYVAAKGGNKFFRNNGDGTFTENAAAMGLKGDPRGTLDMAMGDWDADGDMDIIALKEDGSLQLLNNNRHASFMDITEKAGLNNPKYKGKVVVCDDYNNDGLLDLFIAGSADGNATLLQNTDHGFVADHQFDALNKSLKGITVNDAAFFDFDNDGHKDLLVAGVNSNAAGGGLRLFHNDGKKGFSDVTDQLPQNTMPARHIKIVDFNADGDEDIFLSGPKGVQLIRNDGGNGNYFMKVELTGLAYGNSKNNRLGIGARVELKAGDLYQVKTVTGPVTEFGVGDRNKLDAVRVIWPNGVPQTIVNPARDQRLLEQGQLKGSCPFLFTWNGKKFEFIKDMMWRSALGMPLAVKGTDTIHAFSGPSKEYLLIPGEKLLPQNGRYTIKITEELWEAIFFDKVSMLAVDHPDSIDTYTDERFVPPPYPGMKLYTAAEKYLPVSATDGRGHDLLPKLSRYDFQYVSNFSLGKFQGVADSHDLILDLGSKATTDSLHLFLRGWIFPTDASINTELTQTDKYKVNFPSLQVINKKGQWQTVIQDLGFPMGRDKMVIADLSGKFLTKNDRRVRIRTNMQIYWDNAFFTTGNAKSPVKISTMTMTSAKLAYRGYSASYRKGGPYGPEWFDYYKTSAGQKWRDLTGYYTRYGDVLPLLQQADDQYIIADGGDEVTIDFDALKLPKLPAGWKRDFLIYSEGWVKDGDMNTSYGQTVAPLPFHKMPDYPYGKGVNYPADRQHREYQQKYNTRKVTTQDFKNALKVNPVISK